MKKITLLGAFLLVFTNVNAQFSQNFDAGLTIPLGWSVIQGGDATAGTAGSFQVFAPTVGDQFHSAPNAVQITYTATAHDDYLVTPAITVTAGVSDRLTYWVKNQDPAYVEDYEVNLSTTTATAAAFITNLTPSASAPNAWTQFSIDLTPYLGQTVYIGFHAVSTDMFRLLFDDIVNDAIPSCNNPTAVTASAVMENTATISWTAPASAPAMGYEYYYSTVSTDPIVSTTPSGTTAAGITTTNLTGLSAATIYYAWVRSVCSVSDKSTWSASGTFTTTCSATALNVPYSQNFESAVAPAMPSCTTIQNAGTGNNWTVANNTAAASYGFTSKNLRYAWNTTNAANAWFYTPAINLTAGTSYDISYKYGGTGVTYVENLKVAYGSVATAASMTTVLADHPGITTAVGLTNSVTFTPATTGVYYFGFNCYSAMDKFYLQVDDIMITPSLATNSFDDINFASYPNPVKDILNLSYDKDISNVVIYNLLGQEMLSKSINATQSQIDMSNLSTGTYMVKVTADNQVKTIKVSKQ